MHGHVIGLVALDQILRFFLRGVDSVSLERDFRGNFFLDRAPDSTCFRVPLNMIPTLKSSVIGIISSEILRFVSMRLPRPSALFP